MLASVPIATTLRIMATNLEAERALETEATIGLHFTDLDDADWTLEVRRGVCVERVGRPRDATVRLTTQTQIFKEMLVGIRPPAKALASSDVEVDGSTAQLVKLLLLFNAR